ncbi:24341_t:CDS:1, partial [Gigaspora rosea]
MGLAKGNESRRNQSFFKLFWHSNYYRMTAEFLYQGSIYKNLSKLGAKRKMLKENWSLHLDHGKTYRTTPGKFNIAKLEERNRYRGTISNISTTVYDSLLL